jgi:hypothetical protein
MHGSAQADLDVDGESVSTQKLVGKQENVPSGSTTSRKPIPRIVRPITQADIQEPSWSDWQSTGTAHVEHAVLLSMGIQPSARSLKALRVFQLHKFKEYQRRLKIAVGQIGVGFFPYENHPNEGVGAVGKVVALVDFAEFVRKQAWTESGPMIEKLSAPHSEVIVVEQGDAAGVDFEPKKQARRATVSSKKMNSLLLLLHEFIAHNVKDFSLAHHEKSGTAIQKYFQDDSRKWRLPVSSQTLADYVKEMRQVVANFDKDELARADAVDAFRLEDTRSDLAQ